MNISSLKKVFAGVSATAIMLTQMSTAIAAYSDVSAGVWYEDAVNSFVDAGYLDGSQSRFRGGDLANRAEFVKLVVSANGGLFGTAPSVPSFDDVATGAWYYKYFEEAGKEGWVRGDGSCYGKHPCYARPDANINRAEAAAIIVRTFGLESTGAAPQFVDNPSGQWYTADLQAAADSCVLQGDDATGRARPSDNMNRAEMVVMLDRTLQTLNFDEDCNDSAPVVTEPMITDVVAISAMKIEVSFNMPVDETVAMDKTHYTITGTPNLPIDSIVKTSNDKVELTLTTAMNAGQQYTLNVADMMTTDGEKFSDTEAFSGYTTVVQGDGTLEATLSAKNPVGDTVPKGSQGIVFTSIDLTASSDDVILENLTVLHQGFGKSSDFSGVYAMVDGARVTRKRTIDSQSYTSTLRFTKPLTIAAGKTVTLKIAGDLTTTATTSSEHSLSVELPSDFVSNAKAVEGNFPLNGNSFRIASVTSGTVSITYRTVTPSQIKVGDKAATVGKFELALDSEEDQTIYSMTLQNDGTSSDGDFVNLAIKRSDGTILTKVVPNTVADYATFVFDPPFTVLEGDRITLSVVADIVSGAAKTINMSFDETGDIFAVGSLYGYGVNNQLYGSAVNLGTTTASTVIIDAGQFTISIDGPVTTQFTRKDKNAVLANVWFESGGEPVDIEQLFVLIEGKTSTGGSFISRGAPAAADEVREALEKVELRNTTTGRTVTGEVQGAEDVATGNTGGSSVNSNNGTQGSYAIYRFSDFTVTGKEKYELRVNFIDNSGTSTLAAPANGDKFRIYICGEATHNLVSGALTTNSTGCALGGFISSTVTTYQMKIKGVSTNDRVGDYRPGSTIVGNVQEIKTAGLTITVKPTTATDTSVKNAKNISLLRFEARASEATDVLVTDMIFTNLNGSLSGSLVNGSNYTLWVDKDGDGNVDTIQQKGVSSQSQQVTFDKLTGGGYLVPKQKSVVFEVHADIASSFSGNNPYLALRFDTGSTFFSAEQVSDGSGLSGLCAKAVGATLCDNTNGVLTADIQVTTGTSTIYALRNQGDLYITKSSTPVRSRQLLGGTIADEILRLQFHAEYEDIDVTDLVLTASGAGAAFFSTDVDRLELYKVGATTPFATATVGGCGSAPELPANSMCAEMNGQQFIVPKGSNTNILVRPAMRTDVDGAISGHMFQLMVGSGSSTASGAVRARGLLSSNDLFQNDQDTTPEGEVFLGVSSANAPLEIVGSKNQVVLSKVTSITNADPNNNGTAIPTGTQRAIGQFKFATANANNTKNGTNKFTLTGVIFNVNATNINLDSDTFKIYNTADQTQKKRCSADLTTGSSSLVVTCANINTATGTVVVNSEIDPGSDLTLVLIVDVENGKVSNGSTSTLQTSLQAFDSVTANTFASTGGHLAWADKDNSLTTSFLWIEYPVTSINGTSYNG